MKHPLMALATVLISASLVSAQSGGVRGKILDDKGQPLEGVEEPERARSQAATREPQQERGASPGHAALDDVASDAARIERARSIVEGAQPREAQHGVRHCNCHVALEASGPTRVNGSPSGSESLSRTGTDAMSPDRTTTESGAAWGG